MDSIQSTIHEILNEDVVIPIFQLNKSTYLHEEKDIYRFICLEQQIKRLNEKVSLLEELIQTQNIRIDHYINGDEHIVLKKGVFIK